MKKVKLLLLPLLSMAVFPLMAAQGKLAWNLADKNIWQQTPDSANLSHNFGKLGSITDRGFHFVIDKKYHHLQIDGLKIDSKEYNYVEFYRSGCSMLYTLLAYGPGEGGYANQHKFNSSWDGNDRFYPLKKVEKLDSIPRWKGGNINCFQILFADSGYGSDGTIHAVAFRRGADTLKNGAFLLKENGSDPLFWKAEKSAKIVNVNNFPYPVCRVSGGRISTILDSLKPGHRYLASVYASAGTVVKVCAVDRSGASVFEYELKDSGKKLGNMHLYQAEYVVPGTAFKGDLVLNSAKAYQLGDALVEDMGGAATWRAEWIWSADGIKEKQHCHFRKEFNINDPAELDVAFLQATCDDAFTLEVNNNRIFNNNVWNDPQYTDVKKYLRKGKNVITVSGYNGGSVGGLLCELKLVDKAGKISYIASDASWLCRITPPGENWRRVDPPENTRSGWAPAKSYYVPPYGPWLNMVTYRDEMPEGNTLKELDKDSYRRQKTVARINHDLDHPRMEVNGEIVTPMLYGVSWRGSRVNAYNNVQKSGFKLFRLPWEFSFEAWKSDNSVNYYTLDKAVEELLRNVPDGKIVLEFRLSPPGWWQEKHPDQLIKFADGTTHGADGTFASPASTLWRTETANMVRKFIKHIENQWYAGAIIAYMPCNLRGPEWVIPQKHNCFPDYSEPMQQYFREFLRKKYRTDAALQQAWNNNSVTLASATVPEQKLRQLKDSYFLPPERQDVMDYNRSVHEANVDTIMAMLDAIKDSAPDKLRFLYFGYLMTLSHISANPGITGHYDLSRLLASGKVDVMASPITYAWRHPGDISGTGTVESSYRKHGIVWLQEADNRTYLTPRDAHAVTHHAQASLTENWREFLYAMIKREAVWFFEIGADWYDNDYFHEDFKKMLKLYNEVNKRNITYQTPLAYFFDEKFVDGVSINDGRWGKMKPFTMAAEAQRMIALCGVPYDMFELEDIYDLDLSKYKVLYFQNAWRKNPKLARFLQEKVYPAGKTVVWLYAPGYGQQGGLKGMKELTGFDFDLMPEGTALYFKSNSGVNAGIPGMNNCEAFTVKGKVNVLGRYPNGRIAAAWKNIKRGRSVWLSSYDKSGSLLRDVLKKSGVQPLIDRADRVVFDGEFVGIFAVDAPGKRTVTLPGKSFTQVYDVIEEKVIEGSGNSFTFDALPGDIKLFRIK
ncbi:MAG: hypothetical protein E7056_06470 [Lentisphaerae bacterium]|nr:hypothetical protein [Lentisphaerota bacterium]